jgi:hypothetical protein
MADSVIVSALSKRDAWQHFEMRKIMFKQQFTTMENVAAALP